MLELDKTNFSAVLPLYLREGIVFPLIRAVIQQKQSGWVFADAAAHPAAAIVVTKFGFMQFIGAETYYIAGISLCEEPQPYIPRYLLWYSPPFRAQEILNRFTPGKVRRRERARFTFDAHIIDRPIACPSGFTVRLLDKALMGATDSFNLDISSRFWASPADFLATGIGVCVMKGSDIASLCYSACVVDNLAEIDVVTREDYRGLGLGAVAGQYFIAECMRLGLSPTWDCFTSNIASIRLARRVGFIHAVTYPLYSLNVPAVFAREP